MSEEIATLGGGCFWCLEAKLQGKDLHAVCCSVMSGYAAWSRGQSQLQAGVHRD